MNQFLKETQKQIDKELDKQKSAAKKILITAYDSIVNGSAVDTGLFRTSHIISLNKFNDTVPTVKNDSQIAISRASLGAFKFNDGDFFVIQNNLAYAEALEGGSSKQQAPALYGKTEVIVKRLLNQRIK